MSHYGVIVCLPADTKDINEALSNVLAPYDENANVEPYRSYEDGSPQDYWWVRSVRRGAEHLKNGTGLEERDRSSVVSGRAPKTVEEQRAGYEDDAQWAERLGEHPDWRTVVMLYNAKYHPGNEVAVLGEENDGDDALWYEPESGRAYTMSTYNPDSKWDYWRIGGRWSGYFIATEDSPELLRPSHHWDGPTRSLYPGRVVCDGGPKRLLDFAAMRESHAEAAGKRYDRWESLLAEHGPAKPWSHFAGLAQVEEITWDEARRQYRKQPLIVAVTALEDCDEWLVGWGDCAVEAFTPPRDEYVRLAAASAVPSYALVSLDGRWGAPGRMGWFGMSSDGPGEREAYDLDANRYLDQLAPDDLLVVIDCHI